MVRRITGKVQRQDSLNHTTLREFKGGWNTRDDDKNLSYRYAAELFNMYSSTNGAIEIRPGTEFFVDVSSVTESEKIINFTYFDNRFIVVMDNGDIISVTNDENRTVNDILSEANPVPNPAQPATFIRWGPTTEASFATYGNQLIICNGINKPLVVDFSAQYVCDFLYDPSNVSNINVPICRYVTTVGEWLIMAGDPDEPTRIHISNTGTPGVWFGDPEPNDGAFADLTGIPTTSDPIIRGIGEFRGRLVVIFDNITVIGTLGQFSGDPAKHDPQFNDVLQSYGGISHRAIVNTGDDLFNLDRIGINSLTRSKFLDTLDPQRVSLLIENELQDNLEALTASQLSKNVFVVYDRVMNFIMFCVPKIETPLGRIPVGDALSVYTYHYVPELKVRTWSRFDGWDFTAGCSTDIGRAYFSRNTKIYKFGSTTDRVVTDFEGELDSNGDSLRQAISFVWELPWADFDKRRMIKYLKYIWIEGEGPQNFNVSVFADSYYLGVEDADPPTAYVRRPTVDIDFEGLDVLGYGQGEYGNVPYGGEIDQQNEHKQYIPCRFNIMKLRITGEALNLLKIVSINLAYSEGNYIR